MNIRNNIGCLSVIADCKVLCDICKKSHAKYAREELERNINVAIRTLQIHCPELLVKEGKK